MATTQRTSRIIVLVAAPAVAALASVGCGGPSHQAAPTTVASTPTTQATVAPTAPSIAPPSAPAAGAIDLGNGVRVTPAAGWTSQNKRATSVDLYSPDNTVTLFLTAGPADTTDVTTALQTDVTNTASDPNYHGLQLQGPIDASVTKGTFGDRAKEFFTATATSGGPVYGEYFELLNSQTKDSVFGQFYGPDQAALDRYGNDYTNMILSMG